MKTEYPFISLIIQILGRSNLQLHIISFLPHIFNNTLFVPQRTFDHKFLCIYSSKKKALVRRNLSLSLSQPSNESDVLDQQIIFLYVHV